MPDLLWESLLWVPALGRWAAMLATKVAVCNAPSLSYNRATNLWELTHQGSTRTLGA